MTRKTANRLLLLPLLIMLLCSSTSFVVALQNVAMEHRTLTLLPLATSIVLCLWLALYIWNYHKKDRHEIGAHFLFPRMTRIF